MLLDPHIRVMSEGSCDTEDWCRKFSCNHRNKLHCTIYLHRQQLFCI